MKRLLTIILILLGSIIYAQIDLKCDYREFCIYNENTERFSNCLNEYENSIFKFNKDETVFTHEIGDKSRTYYVTDIDHNKTEGEFIYYVTANKTNYIVQVDLETRLLRIIEENYISPSKVCLIRYYISEING